MKALPEVVKNWKTNKDMMFQWVACAAALITVASWIRDQRPSEVIAEVLRLVGVLLIVIGLKGMFGLLPMLFKVLPFLGSIVDAGVGLVSWIFGLAWSLIIIAIAWLVFRPIIGISLLVLAIAGIVFLKRRGKKNEEK